MRWILVMNALGILVGAAYTGYAFTPSHTPVWAGIATFLFLVGLFIPLGAEYGSIGKGFDDVSGDYVEARRREHGLGPKVEILVDKPPTKAFRGSNRTRIWGLIIFVIALGLLLFDVAEWQTSTPPAPEKSGKICNF